MILDQKHHCTWSGVQWLILDQKHTCVCVSVKYWLDLVAQHLCGVWCATHGIVYNPLLLFTRLPPFVPCFPVFSLLVLQCIFRSDHPCFLFPFGFSEHPIHNVYRRKITNVARDGKVHQPKIIGD